MNKLERMLENNLEDILGGYMNGMMDYPEDYKEMTKEEVIEYCIPDIYNQLSNGGHTRYRDGIAEELKFLGNKYIHSRIITVAEECGILSE